MKLLYLTEDYLYSKVHNNLLCNMLDQYSELTIYVLSPVRHDNSHGIENEFRHHERLIEISQKIDIPIWLYKLDFWAKLRCKIRLIEKYIPIKKIDVIHAATLFTEGATALYLKKKYRIPYLASIRGTDAMFYANKMPHLWMTGINVMRQADALLCVTPAIKDKMLQQWQFFSVRNIIKKADIVNNGIDKIWLNNLRVEPRPIGTPVRILYIGRFDKNKNVLRLIESIKKIQKKYDIALTLVGGKGSEHKAVLRQVSENNNYMEYLGPIYNKQQLLEVVRRCDIFAMVSHSETFGLVYAECLTQGLPLLYTKGTGFDKIYVQGKVGYGVCSHSKTSIEKGLVYLIEHYMELKIEISKIVFDRFSWSNIACRYWSYYNSIG